MPYFASISCRTFRNVKTSHSVFCSYLLTAQWVPVETLGYRPPPCAAFSFTKIDTSRVVLFGGRQRIQRVNDIYVLDLEDLV